MTNNSKKTKWLRKFWKNYIWLSKIFSLLHWLSLFDSELYFLRFSKKHFLSVFGAKNFGLQQNPRADWELFILLRNSVFLQSKVFFKERRVPFRKVDFLKRAFLMSSAFATRNQFIAFYPAPWLLPWKVFKKVKNAKMWKENNFFEKSNLFPGNAFCTTNEIFSSSYLKNRCLKQVNKAFFKKSTFLKGTLRSLKGSKTLQKI